MKKLILTAAGVFVLVLTTNNCQSYGQGFYNPPPVVIPPSINYQGGYNPQIPWTVIDPWFAGEGRSRSRRSQPNIGARREGTSHDSNVNANVEQIKSGDKVVTIYQASLMDGEKTLLIVEPDTELVAQDVQRNQSGKWILVSVSGETAWIQEINLTVNSSKKVFSWKKLSGRGAFYDSSAKLIIIGGTTWNGGQAQLAVKTRPRKIKKIGVFIDTQGARWWYKGVHSLRRGGTVDIYVNKVRIHRIVCNVKGKHGDYWSQEAGPGSAGYDTGLLDVSDKNINGPILNIKIVVNSGSAVDINGIAVSFDFEQLSEAPLDPAMPRPSVPEDKKFIPGYQPTLRAKDFE